MENSGGNVRDQYNDNIAQKIPVSVLVVTKNEEDSIVRCLQALKAFDEIVVVDSNSDDATCQLARSLDARVENFTWNGQYPKKRQWCLDNLKLKHDWVFFVDADEVMTSDVVDEVAQKFSKKLLPVCGFFVRSDYIWNGVRLQHGLKNNKLVLFHRDKIAFPVVDDLDLPGMGEIEGHYQPRIKDNAAGDGESLKLGQIRSCMLHYAREAEDVWESRHLRYAQWEAAMLSRNAYPRDHGSRRFMKAFFVRTPLLLRGFCAFVHSYIVKLGFLDGANGYDFARSRMHYYNMVRHAFIRMREF